MLRKLIGGVAGVVVATASAQDAGWRDWQDADFFEAWAAVPVPDVSTMTVIQTGGVSEALTVAMRLDFTAGGNGGWDDFGTLENWVVAPMPDAVASRTYDRAALDGVPGTVLVHEALVAGSLVGSTGSVLDVSGLIGAVVISDAFGNAEYGNMYFLPGRVWDSLDAATTHVWAQSDAFWEAEDAAVTRGGGGADGFKTQPEFEGPIIKVDPETQACLDQYLQDYINCWNERAGKLQDCLDEHEDCMSDAEVALEDCLDNVGFWDRLEMACILGGGGTVVGGGIGTIVPGVGTVIGGVAGGCGGFVGGLLGGAAHARGECYSAAATAYKQCTRRLENCVNRAQRDFDRCVEAAIDRFFACLLAVRD